MVMKPLKFDHTPNATSVFFIGSSDPTSSGPKVHDDDDDHDHDDPRSFTNLTM